MLSPKRTKIMQAHQVPCCFVHARHIQSPLGSNYPSAIALEWRTAILLSSGKIQYSVHVSATGGGEPGVPIYEGRLILPNGLPIVVLVGGEGRGERRGEDAEVGLARRSLPGKYPRRGSLDAVRFAGGADWSLPPSSQLIRCYNFALVQRSALCRQVVIEGSLQHKGIPRIVRRLRAERLPFPRPHIDVRRVPPRMDPPVRPRANLKIFMVALTCQVSQCLEDPTFDAPDTAEVGSVRRDTIFASGPLGGEPEEIGSAVLQ
mmetsp:Transcript_12996/g.38179  ORF Transcript_12996/g.38179 Transcript_12996/m.38179 type:complete len:261 (+) Transcript_12996:718-1500(+)